MSYAITILHTGLQTGDPLPKALDRGSASVAIKTGAFLFLRVHFLSEFFVYNFYRLKMLIRIPGLRSSRFPVIQPHTSPQSLTIPVVSFHLLENPSASGVVSGLASFMSQTCQPDLPSRLSIFSRASVSQAINPPLP